MRDRSNDNDETQSAIIRSKTSILSSSALKLRGSSALKGIRTSSKPRGSFKTDSSIKDPKVAAVAQMLAEKKVA